MRSATCTTHSQLLSKEVNTVSEAVLIWPPVRYILDTSQYWCTDSGLPLFYILYIYTKKKEKRLMILLVQQESCLPN